MAKVSVKSSHPNKSRARAGMLFGVTPVEVPDDEVTQDMLDDNWLVVADYSGDLKPTSEQVSEQEPVTTEQVIRASSRRNRASEPEAESND